MEPIMAVTTLPAPPAPEDCCSFIISCCFCGEIPNVLLIVSLSLAIDLPACSCILPKSSDKPAICQESNAIIPAITANKMRIQKTADNPRLIPFFPIQRLSGRNNMASIPAIMKGTKNGFAKYNPAKSIKKRNRICMALDNDNFCIK